MSRLLASLILLAACGSSSMMGDDAPDDPRPDSGLVTTLDPADCAPFAQSFVAAAQSCGASVPASVQSQVESWCRKGVTAAAMCGGNPTGGLDCFATSDATDWVCYAGEPYPSCNGDLASALGAYCLVALGNPQCASGIKCEYDADCSSGSKCNSATEQCVSESAYCIGLPCKYDADCPNGEKCNGAEGACVGD